MKVFLSGQKYFGQQVFGMLLEKKGVDIVGVSAPVETLSGRPDRLYRAAVHAGVPVTCADGLNAATVPEGLDVIVCAHSHSFISGAMRAKTKLGGFGYHPSLLPLHRGRDAVYWAVRTGTW